MKELSLCQRRGPAIVFLICNFLGVAKFTTAHYLYSFHSDLESVEKLTVDYANGRSGFVLERPIVLEPMDKVCRLERDLKVTLCWKFMKNEEYKFKFTFNMDADTLHTECSYERIFLRILDKTELDPNSSKIRMFRCPFIGEAPFLRKAVAFYISDTHLPSSIITAIVYMQESQFTAIYPYAYLERINIGDLEASKELLYITNPPPQNGKNELNELYKVNRLELDSSAEKIEVVEMLIEGIEIQGPYSKFQVFYKAIDLCALSMSQKIFLCRETVSRFDAHENRHNIDIDEYTEDSCRNYELNLNNSKHKVTAFACPPVVEYHQVPDRWWEKIYNPAVYFLLKNPFGSRLSLLKLTKNGMEIESQVKNVDSSLLEKVKKIENTKELTRHKARSELQPTPDYEGEKPNHVYKLAFPIAVNRRIAEENALKLVKIKDMESPYEKFTITLEIRNICALRTKQKFELCKKIFTNQALWYTIEENYDNLRVKCNQEPISLVTSKVISSNEAREDAFTLPLLNCPTVYNQLFPIGLYLSSSLQPNSVLAYDQSYNYRKINPLTTVAEGVFDGIV